MLTQLSLLFSAEVGAKFVGISAGELSPDTLLRLARNNRATIDSADVCHIGLDDWAFLKGHNYGTLIVDHDKHRPIALLPDREVETIKAWLVKHPNIKIITRDRYQGYADACTQGAPQAIQVADRWHLLRNLSSALQKVIDREYLQLGKAWNLQHHQADTVNNPVGHEAQKASPEANNSSIEVEPALVTSIDQAERVTLQETLYSPTPKQLLRQERIKKARELRDLGWGKRRIGRYMKISRQTVLNYLKRDPGWYLQPRRPYPGKLDAYHPYLSRRWEEGCTNAKLLLEEIKEQGYRGSYSILKRFIASKRTEPATQIPTMPRTTELMWAYLLAGDKIKDKEAKEAKAKTDYLSTLIQELPEVRFPVQLLKQGWDIIRSKSIDGFHYWLEVMRCSKDRILTALAKGFDTDLRAIEKAIELPWSNGPTEGQVNRLKMIKRQMFGRAKFDLLSAKVLYPG
jgi:transposase